MHNLSSVSLTAQVTIYNKTPPYGPPPLDLQTSWNGNKVLFFKLQIFFNKIGTRIIFHVWAEEFFFLHGSSIERGNTIAYSREVTKGKHYSITKLMFTVPRRAIEISHSGSINIVTVDQYWISLQWEKIKAWPLC